MLQIDSLSLILLLSLSKQLLFSKEKIVIIEDGGGGDIEKLQEDNLLKKLKEGTIVFPKKNKRIF